MNHRYSFDDVEKWLNRRGLLKMQPGYTYTNNIPTSTPYDFIKWLLASSFRARATVFAKSGKKQATGYRRSVGDIYRLCKYYFPDVSLVEVYNVLVRLVKEKRVYSNVCHVVKKRVFSSDSAGNPSRWNSFYNSSVDEYGVEWSELPDSPVNKSTIFSHYLNNYKIK